MGPQSDFKESISEGKPMEQRCLPARCSEMEKATAQKGYSLTVHRPGNPVRITEGRLIQQSLQKPGQEPVLVEDFGGAKSPLLPLRRGEDHCGEDGSTFHGERKSLKIETVQDTAVKT